jgi:hypothetical protein
VDRSPVGGNRDCQAANYAKIILITAREPASMVGKSTSGRTSSMATERGDLSGEAGIEESSR